MKKMRLHFVTLLSALFLVISVKANNIRISNVSVLPGSNQIQFDLAWDNSWRSNVLLNWDAAWVFMKYKDVDGAWKHLQFTDVNNAVPAGYTADVAGDKNGVMIYRSAAGNGNVTITGIKLGIPSQHALGVYDIRVFGIEMVYIPTGAFWAGDNSASLNSYSSSGSTPPALIDANITSIYDPIAGGPVNLNTPSGINASVIPTGYNSFYCMKYELTQGAYRDFLNTLLTIPQTTRTSTSPFNSSGTLAVFGLTSIGANIKIATPATPSTPAVYGCDANNNNIFNEANDGEWASCNYLSWPDIAAYLNWACLAPMSELQFEKICRGPLQPVSNEFPWGTSQVAFVNYTLANAASANETITNASTIPGEGNALYTGTYLFLNISGNIRNGIFATATSDRVQSGGSFYGVMEMGGSMWENVITTANLTGRLYNGANGNATFDVFGNAKAPSNWPGTVPCFLCGTSPIDGSTNAVGLMYRGGSTYFSAAEMKTSNRNPLYVVTSTTETGKWEDHGVRGVRN